MSDDKLGKNMLDDDYTIRHADGSRSRLSKHVLDDGYTVSHPIDGRSKVTKDVLGDGYTITHPDGSRSHATKNLFNDGYTITGPDGSRSQASKNILDDGYTIKSGLPRGRSSASVNPLMYIGLFGAYRPGPKPLWLLVRTIWVVFAAFGVIAWILAGGNNEPHTSYVPIAVFGGGALAMVIG